MFPRCKTIEYNLNFLLLNDIILFGIIRVLRTVLVIGLARCAHKINCGASII